MTLGRGRGAGRGRVRADNAAASYPLPSSTSGDGCIRESIWKPVKWWSLIYLSCWNSVPGALEENSCWIRNKSRGCESWPHHSCCDFREVPHPPWVFSFFLWKHWKVISAVREGKFSPVPVLSAVGGVIVKLMQDSWTGEKEKNFTPATRWSWSQIWPLYPGTELILETEFWVKE